MNSIFSLTRLMAIFIKEFRQISRDKFTFALIIGIPIMQLVLFGFAINSNPKNLFTAIINGDVSPFTRTITTAIQNSDYFKITRPISSEKEAELALARGDVQFVFNFPTNFSRDLVRGDRPDLLVTVDATDPMASINAITALQQMTESVFELDAQRGLPHLESKAPPVNLVVHTKYNPERISQFNIVPALMGVVLTMTMVMITSLAITRERERGTMENLLSTPVRPLEVMIGKVMPYILVGYIQLLIIVLTAEVVFHVPFEGSVLLLLVLTLPFIAANLTVGLTLSTMANNQLQSVQLAIFFFLPSILLSGFMFPVQGMPESIQWISEILPLTHYLKIVRGIILKGNSITIIWPEVVKILMFMLVVVLLGLKRFKRTLD